MKKSSARGKRIEAYYHRMRFASPSEFRSESLNTGNRQSRKWLSNNSQQRLQSRDGYELIPEIDLCDICNEMNGFACGRRNLDTHKTSQDQIVIEVQAACRITITASGSTRVKVESLLPSFPAGK